MGLTGSLSPYGTMTTEEKNRANGGDVMTYTHEWVNDSSPIFTIAVAWRWKIGIPLRGNAISSQSCIVVVMMALIMF